MSKVFEKVFLTCEEVGKMLNVSREYVSWLCNYVKIFPAIKEKGQWKIPLSAVHEYEVRRRAEQGGYYGKTN